MASFSILSRWLFVPGLLLVIELGCAMKCGTPDEHTTAPHGGRACTDIGCADGLLIRITPSEAWPHGDYRFSIEHDGATTTCIGALPLPACDTRGISCDGSEVQIAESGCALDPSLHAFGDIMFASTPQSVTVDISLNGARVGGGRFAPEFQTIQPNGPGCEPICTNAAVDLPLAFD